MLSMTCPLSCVLFMLTSSLFSELSVISSALVVGVVDGVSVFLKRLGGVSCVKLASPVSESLSYSS